MGLVTRVKSALSDFRNGLSVLISKPKEGTGDRKLAKMSKLVAAQIPAYGKDAVRTQVIKSIESDLKRANKKSIDGVDKLLATAIATPEYMSMLHKLGLEEPHLRVMAMEAKKKHA